MFSYAPLRMLENHFDEDVAADYDVTERVMFEDGVLGPSVDLLAELADGGPALEFGIGTGRVSKEGEESGAGRGGSWCPARQVGERLETDRGYDPV